MRKGRVSIREASPGVSLGAGAVGPYSKSDHTLRRERPGTSRSGTRRGRRALSPNTAARSTSGRTPAIATTGTREIHDGNRLRRTTTHRNAAAASIVDVDEADTAASFELPGADLSWEELSVRVVP